MKSHLDPKKIIHSNFSILSKNGKIIQIKSGRFFLLKSEDEEMKGVGKSRQNHDRKNKNSMQRGNHLEDGFCFTDSQKKKMIKTRFQSL